MKTSFFRYPFLPLCLALSSPALAVEETNHQTGINIDISGVEGKDFLIERLYHNRLESDRKVIYIKSTTKFSFTHNQYNRASFSGTSFTQIGIDGRDALPNSGDEGIIRYKVDQDLRRTPSWTSGSHLRLGSEQASFSDLKYHTGASVVGSVGPEPGISVLDSANYFWRGQSDSFGDEWHTLTIWDDDSAVQGINSSTEFKASDGFTMTFVVDPKHPVFSVNPGPSCQFFTSRPKAYFVPNIGTQTTYILGEAEIVIADLYGREIVASIVGSSKTYSSATGRLVIATSELKTGSNKIQFSLKGSNVKKIREVVMNPDFPSALESHGAVLWGSESRFLEIKKRLSREPYSGTYNVLKNLNVNNNLADVYANSLLGRRFITPLALINAFAAKVDGIASAREGYIYADIAKRILLRSSYDLDPIGVELFSSGLPLPSREVVYRGYFDCNAAFDAAAAYDILIDIYNSKKSTNGITPIEDFLIREKLATYAHSNMIDSWVSHKRVDDGTVNWGGMWDSARRCAGVLVATVIPTYKSDVLGVSGVDGNVNLYPWTPFPDRPLTWKQAFIDQGEMSGKHPNAYPRLGLEYGNFNDDLKFVDRIDYTSLSLMGRPAMIAANILKQNHGVLLKNTVGAYELSGRNLLYGLKSNVAADLTPRGFVPILLLNQSFPNVHRSVLVYAKDKPSSDAESVGKLLYRAGVFGLVWYEDIDPTATAPTRVQVRVHTSE